MVKKKIIYIVTVILSILYIFIGNKIVLENSNSISSLDLEYTKAKVTKILDIEEKVAQAGNSEKDKDITITFEAKIISKKNNGSLIESEQIISYPNAENAIELKVGDRVLLLDAYEDEDGNTVWKYVDRERITPVILLGVIFILL